jgi:tetratricopeptide (TPR) repeat protein
MSDSIQEAMKGFAQSLETNPLCDQALCGLGKCFFRLGNITQAMTLFQQAVDSNPSNAEALSCLGSTYGALNNNKLAIANFLAAEQLDPSLVKAIYNLGIAYAAEGDEALALKKLAQVIQLDPNHLNAHYNRGILLAKTDQLDSAILDFQHNLKLDPKHAASHYQLALALHKQKNYSLAIQHYESALNLGYSTIDTYFALGLCYEDQKEFHQALVYFTLLINEHPQHFDAYLKKGNIEKILGDNDRALDSYRQALALRPNEITAFLSVADAKEKIGDFTAAENMFLTALQTHPDYEDNYFFLCELYANHAETKKFDIFINRALSFSQNKKYLFDLSFGLLKMQYFKAGFETYEHRLEFDSSAKMNLYKKIPTPEWNGVDSLAGKKLLVFSEQGYGDSLQFCRYLLLLLESAAQIIFYCPTPLEKLLRSLTPSHQLRFITQEPKCIESDYKVFLMSLPYKLGLTHRLFKPEAPYLHVSEAKKQQWQGILGKTHLPRIGLAWSGNKEHKQDHYRSMSLKTLSSYLPRGFQYIVLQKTISDDDLEELNKREDFFNLNDMIKDFSDSAGICAHLDLVISVDSAPAHLAGALGVPTWLLLAFKNDWRWGVNTVTTPWYSSMHIFRQTKYADWSTPLEAIQKKLTEGPLPNMLKPIREGFVA